MARERWWPAWVLMSSILAAPAPAQAAPAGDPAASAPAAPRYPFPAALRLEARTARAVYRHPEDAAGLKPGLPPATAPLGQQAARAYAVLVGARFAPAGDGAAELILEVSLERAELALDSDGWFAAVAHQVVLLDAAGAELGRWRAEGRGRLQGKGAATISRAFSEAADAAARQLGLRLEVEPAPAWTAWLAARGQGPAPAAAALEERRRELEASRPPPPPPRAVRSWFLEGGAASLAAGEARSVAAVVRGGWSGEWLVAAASLRAWPTDFEATPPEAWGSSPATLSVTELGLEGGWPLRLGADVELRLGAGVQLLYGSGSTTYVPLDAPTTTRDASFSSVGLAASVTLGASYVSPLSVFGGRVRLGLDVRRDLGATLHLADAGRDLTVAEWSLLLTAGLEWPTAWSPFGP